MKPHSGQEDFESFTLRWLASCAQELGLGFRVQGLGFRV